MRTLDRLEIFLEVARLQSFAKAARQLGITGPAASKQVQALEDELGVKLLNRTTRLVALTDEGALYYDRARPAFEELREAAEQAQESKASPRGPLRVAVPLSLGQMHLMPAISGFAKKYPDVTVEAVFDDRTVDVIAEGFDIAIRVGVPEPSSLVSRTLGATPMLLVASPAYLAAHGTPAAPDDLAQHRIIAYTHHGGAGEWRWKAPDGTTGTTRSHGHFRANNAEMMLQAVLDGIGIAQLPSFCVSTHLQAGNILRVLPQYDTVPERHITALMPPNRYRSAKVRLFLDWMVNGCKAIHL